MATLLDQVPATPTVARIPVPISDRELDAAVRRGRRSDKHTASTPLLEALMRCDPVDIYAYPTLIERLVTVWPKADATSIASAIVQRQAQHYNGAAEQFAHAVLSAVRTAQSVHDAKALRPAGERRLDIGSHAELAQRVISEHLLDALADEGDVWSWTGARWEIVPEHALSRWIQAWDGAFIPRGEGSELLRVASGTVSSTIQLAYHQLAQPDCFRSAPGGLAFRNGFLRLDGSGRFEALCPEHRNRVVLDCDYSTEPLPAPHWDAFARSIWGDDQESIQLLNEILGYLLSERTDLQKIFLLIGPPRAGKGTVFRLIARILGDACGAFKVARLGREFSAECLLGKTVSIDPDVRRPGGDEGPIVERLLSISGEDRQAVPRKHIGDIQVTLKTRLMLGANPPFGLKDAGGALASRLVILRFPHSFLHREDPGLLQRLEAEIPAIVQRGLAALQTLEQRGRFLEPASSRDERTSIEYTQEPMARFVAEECVSDPAASVRRNDFYQAVKVWRQDQGHHPISNAALGEYMRQHFRAGRPGTDDRVSLWLGLRLRSAAERSAQTELQRALAYVGVEAAGLAVAADPARALDKVDAALQKARAELGRPAP